MEYSTGELARLAGLSTRTLRWYDEKGLLTPVRTDAAGVRYYGTAEVDRLQQIMLYRALGMSLSQIHACLENASISRLAALRGHLDALTKQRKQLDDMISAVMENIAAEERGEIMKDEMKFEMFKKNLVEENEQKYGAEAREKYGDDSVNTANAAMMNMSPEQFEKWQTLEREILFMLEKSVSEVLSPASDFAKEIAGKHREWLTMSTGRYSREMHRGIAQMYVMDERFTAYYDKKIPGCAQFLTDAVLHWI